MRSHDVLMMVPAILAETFFQFMILSSLTGFCDAAVAPIDFPVAPAAAMPKVILSVLVFHVDYFHYPGLCIVILAFAFT